MCNVQLYHQPKIKEKRIKHCRGNEAKERVRKRKCDVKESKERKEGKRQHGPQRERNFFTYHVWLRNRIHLLMMCDR